MVRALTACSASGTSVSDPAKGPGPSTEVADPLDGMPEGEPQCSTTGWCWESPYVPSTMRGLHAAAVEGAPLWAVGDDGTILRSRSHGDAWRKMVVPTTKNLHAVFALDKRVAWVVGAEGTVLAFDGQAWSAVDLGLGLDATATLTAVWASSANDVWIVGHADEKVKGRVGLVIHGDGTTWTRDVGPHLPLYAVSGTAANDVWIGGGGAAGGFDSAATELARWDGSSWTWADPPEAAGIVAGLVVLASTAGVREVYATTNTPSSGANAILRFDGSAWKTDHETRDKTLGAMALDAWGAPLAIGPQLLGRGADGKWTAQSTETMSGVHAIWAVDERRTIVAGDDGGLVPLGAARPLTTKPGQRLPTNHYTFSNGLFELAGGKWSLLKAPEMRNGRRSTFSFGVGNDANAILLVAQVEASDTDGYTEGYVWDGKRWDAYGLPVGGGYFDPRDVARTANGDTWFTTRDANAVVTRHSRGGAPLPVPSCPPSNRPSTATAMYAVGDHVYAPGLYRNIEHFDPQGTCTWIKTQDVAGFGGLESLDGTSASDLWVLTNATKAPSDGTTPTIQTHDVYRSDGVSVRKVGSVEIPTADAPYGAHVAIRVTGADEAWIVGTRWIHRWNGSTFERLDLGVPNTIAFADVWKNGNDVRLVASGGRVLKKP